MQQSAVTCPDCRSGNVERRGYTKGEDTKQRLVCFNCSRWFTVPLTYTKEPSWERSSKEVKEFLQKDRFIITSAQNNTALDEKFWGAITQLAKYYKAQILVVPVLYRNPTALQITEVGEAWWPKEVIPYLIQNNVSLCKGLRLLGGIRVNATAVNPLVGLEVLSQGDSGIVGHAQIQMRTLAAPQHTLPKILHTTGSVSVKNYSDTKYGAKGSFHHSLGAVIVEKDKGCFHLRSVVGDERSEFYDINLHVTAKGVRKISMIEGLVTGDTHAIFHSPSVRKATFDAADSIVNVTNPKIIVRHDLIDSYSISHHHRGRTVTAFKKWLTGTNSLQAELEGTARFVEETTPKGTLNVVVASNHHEHINRWLEEADPKEEPWNAILYHELMLSWLKAVRDGVEDFDPFEFWMKKHCKVSCTFTRRSDSYIIKDILISMHGDKGPNGSRGSIQGLSKMGVKTVIGHCLTSNHSVLTRTGWRAIAEVSDTEEILSYQDGSNCWVKPLEKQEYIYSGRIIRLNNSHAFRQEVTPGHHLYLKNRGYIPICEALLTETAANLPLTAEPVFSGHLKLPELQLRQIVAACADGSFDHGSLSFNIKKQRKHARLEYLFKGCLRPPQAPNKHNGAVKRSIVKYSDAYNNVVEYVISETSSKILPEVFRELIPECRDIVLDELKYWDGTFKENGGGQQFSSFKEKEANLVASLATLQGYRTSMFKRPDSRGWVVSWCTDRNFIFSSNQQHDAARVAAWGFSSFKVENIPVYCFTTPTRNFWIMEHKTGKVSLTGNSHTPSVEKGCYMVGTSSSLSLEYSKDGPSSWLNSHCLIHSNGKRQLVNIVKGRWRRDPGN